LWWGLGISETLHLIVERVDDMPGLLAHLEQMGMQRLLDEQFPTHGIWVRRSRRWVTVL
jgi:hypothetical protein